MKTFSLLIKKKNYQRSLKLQTKTKDAAHSITLSCHGNTFRAGWQIYVPYIKRSVGSSTVHQYVRFLLDPCFLAYLGFQLSFTLLSFGHMYALRSHMCFIVGLLSTYILFRLCSVGMLASHATTLFGENKVQILHARWTK